MTRPNQARRGGSVKRGKRFLQEKQGTVWHLSPNCTAIMGTEFLVIARHINQEINVETTFSFPELRALYTRLWYLEKAGKLKRIKP